MWFALSHVCAKASNSDKKQTTLLKQQNQLLSDQILAQSDPAAYKALVAKREEDTKIAKEAQAKQTKTAAICASVLAAILGIGVIAAGVASKHPSDDSSASLATSAPSSTPSSIESPSAMPSSSDDTVKDPATRYDDMVKVIFNKATGKYSRANREPNSNEMVVQYSKEQADSLLGEAEETPTPTPTVRRAEPVVQRTPSIAPVPAETFAQADAELNRAWYALPKATRHRLLNGQKEWLKNRDQLSPEDKILETENRTTYLESQR
jgi:hypothetical protein